MSQIDVGHKETSCIQNDFSWSVCPSAIYLTLAASSGGPTFFEDSTQRPLITLASLGTLIKSTTCDICRFINPSISFCFAALKFGCCARGSLGCKTCSTCVLLNLSWFGKVESISQYPVSRFGQGQSLAGVSSIASLKRASVKPCSILWSVLGLRYLLQRSTRNHFILTSAATMTVSLSMSMIWKEQTHSAMGGF